MPVIKQKPVDRWLLHILFLCVAGIIVTPLFGLGAVTSLLFAATFPLTGLLWLLGLKENRNRLDAMILLIIALSGCVVLVDLKLHHGEFSIVYFKKFIMFGTTLLFLQGAGKVQTDRCLAHFIQIPLDLITLLMLIMYVIKNEEMHMIAGVVSRYLTFGFSNPNLLGMFLVCMYLLTLSLLLQEGDRKQKLFRGVILVLQLWFLLKTQSRNGIMVAALFTAITAVVFFREKIQNRLGIKLALRFGKGTTAFVVLVPFAFAVVYMLVVDSDLIGRIFGFMASEGKQLDSRVKMWAPAFEAIEASPLLGSYFAISDGTGAGQMHNTHVDMAASYGIPVLVLVCWLLGIHIHQQGKEYADRIGFLYMAAFCCVILMGTFEAVLFSGGLGFYVFAVIFLPLSGSHAVSLKELPLWANGPKLMARWKCLIAKRIREKKHDNQ